MQNEARNVDQNADYKDKVLAIEEQLNALAGLLKSYRKAKGLSQMDVANKSGLTRQMVSKLETNTSIPTLATLIRYLHALDINFIELMKKYIQQS